MENRHPPTLKNFRVTNRDPEDFCYFGGLRTSIAEGREHFVSGRHIGLHIEGIPHCPGYLDQAPGDVILTINQNYKAPRNITLACINLVWLLPFHGPQRIIDFLPFEHLVFSWNSRGILCHGPPCLVHKPDVLCCFFHISSAGIHVLLKEFLCFLRHAVICRTGGE